MDDNKNQTFLEKLLRNSTKLKMSHLYWSWQPQNINVQKNFVNPVAYNNGQSGSTEDWEYMPLVPVLATIMLAATVFLLVIFRQSPALVAATIAACLTIISIYLLLSTIEANRVKYE